MAGIRLIQINSALISNISGYAPNDFHEIHVLDLHLRDEDGKIRKIENLSMVPNLRQLNLSYNAILKMEGFERLNYLVELNLAENSISKIENLESLRSLQKLNLSGNEIERIPENIQLLTRLTHFRIARNKLRKLDDIGHLTALNRLTNFRIDENPITQTPNFSYYVIFENMHLRFLDGVEITDEMREKALNIFGSNNLHRLKNQIILEHHRLARLKKQIMESKEKEIIENQASYDQQLIDKANQSFSFRVNELKETEELIERLESIVRTHSPKDEQQDFRASASHTQSAIKQSSSMKKGEIPPIKEDSSYHDRRLEVHLQSPFSPSEPHFIKSSNAPFTSSAGARAEQNKELLSSRPNRRTSYSSSPPEEERRKRETEKQGQYEEEDDTRWEGTPAPPFSNNPQASFLASKRLTELNSRIEKLTQRLLNSESEKQELLLKIEKTKEGYDLAQQEMNEMDINLENAVIALQSANEENSKLKRQFQELKISKDVEIEEKEKKFQMEINGLQKQNQDLLDKVDAYQKRIQSLATEASGPKISLEKKYQSEREQKLKLTNENQEIKNLIHQLKSDNIQLQGSQEQSQTRNYELEKKNYELSQTIERLENDIDELIKIKKSSPSMLHQGSSSNRRIEKVGKYSPINDNYYGNHNNNRNNEDSSSSSISLDVIPVHHSLQALLDNNSNIANDLLHKRPLSKLEQVAAEVVAATLLEEFEKLNIPAASQNMKIACVKTALRIIHTGINVSYLVGTEEAQGSKKQQQSQPEEGSEEVEISASSEQKENNYFARPILSNHNYEFRGLEQFKHLVKSTLLPLKEFGNKKVLTRLVSDALAGIVTYEDSNNIKKEIKQLEVSK
jgi:hypothetical protein